jgi:acetyl/propionyl-CoA carboxylase alpha subunit
MPGIVFGDEVFMFKSGDGYTEVNGKKTKYSILRADDGCLVIRLGNEIREIIFSEDRDFIEMFSSGTTIKFQILSDRDLLLRNLTNEESGHHRHAEIKAPMPGLVVKVLAKRGDSLKRGETVVILEAMKMENEIRVSQDSEVADVLVKEGDIVEKGQVITALK